MRVNKLNIDEDSYIASLSQKIKDKIIFLSKSDLEYNNFKNDITGYQDGQPSGAAYALSRIVSMYG